MTTTIQELQALTPAIAADPAAARQAKLVNAAHEFEGVLLQEMLKSMTSGKDEFAGSGEEDGGSGDTLRSYGTEAVATAISRAGGIGIAKQVIAKVTKETHQRSGESS